MRPLHKALARFSAVVLLLLSGTAYGQMIPRLVTFSGKALNAQGGPIVGTASITFALHKDRSDSAPLWTETQNVQTRAKGEYTVQLGVTEPEGLPLGLLTTNGARWLGVRVEEGEEEPRVLLLSVPYALIAVEAETVGGLPPSAFVLAGPVAAGGVPSGVSPIPNALQRRPRR